MNDYFQYVHNLKGKASFDRFRRSTREAIVSLFLRPIDDHNTLEKTILRDTNREVLNYIGSFINLKAQYNKTILSTETSSYVEKVDFNNVENIINLRRINYTRRPNKLFRSVNTLLPEGGIFICRVETYYDRKMNFLSRYGRLTGYLIWVLDFIANRVLPRLNYLKWIYDQITRGRLHSISDCEMLGRLVYCGFEIVDYRIFNLMGPDRITYFVARKKREPLSDNPSFYPLIRLKRVCRFGRLTGIYKLRTMHPYAEYIQDYMVMKNGYDITGKPAKDFRITCWGKLLRKYRLDEIPQMINVLRGEMKLVGLRPLSLTRFREIPSDLKLERIRQKPGCIPPYIALNMPSDWQRIEAERIYLAEYKQSPLRTDIKYFLLAVRNILLRRTF